MDYFLAGKDQQQTNQPNDLAGGWPINFNLDFLTLSNDKLSYWVPLSM